MNEEQQITRRKASFAATMKAVFWSFFGVRKSNHPCSTWTERCLAWLHSLGVLKADA